ncbi:very short patch repair endonuclease [Roseiflexus sp.]|uniref:very short patch repair endonuclease n=1 Tax=Roseiflexus sp. TaxID=2562120 RepID=UPI0021DCA821|nr:very short patch repair endonuclease [Roseiflexus sp.]GIW00358.1 MAG: very short patch repair endonuclease [Roseiflexus sp.]
MPDVFQPEERSRIMAKVRGENTSPERLVRSLVHRMGYRFRLHCKDLPGKPDIVLPRHKKVIFVHGCFWHQHEGCPHAARPTSNIEYWDRKLDRNMVRDRENLHKLAYLGWNVLIVWECETRDREKLLEKLKGFLVS